MNRDGVILYPHQASGQRVQDKHTHDIGLEADPRFVWSPDDNWVAFTDIIGPEGDWYAVILSPSGEMLRDTLPIDPDYDTALVWLDDTHLEVRTSHRSFPVCPPREKFQRGSRQFKPLVTRYYFIAPSFPAILRSNPICPA